MSVVWFILWSQAFWDTIRIPPGATAKLRIRSLGPNRPSRPVLSCPNRPSRPVLCSGGVFVDGEGSSPHAAIDVLWCVESVLRPSVCEDLGATTRSHGTLFWQLLYFIPPEGSIQIIPLWEWILMSALGKTFLRGQGTVEPSNVKPTSDTKEPNKMSWQVPEENLHTIALICCQACDLFADFCINRDILNTPKLGKGLGQAALCKFKLPINCRTTSGLLLVQSSLWVTEIWPNSRRYLNMILLSEGQLKWVF